MIDPKSQKQFSPDILEKLSNLPRVTLNERQLCDLELLLTGGFAPLTGFMKEDEYVSVRDQMRLPSGSLWPMPIVLDRPKSEKNAVGDEVILTDTYGNPIALMRIESIYYPDKELEANAVYGTIDPDHPGVGYLFREGGEQYLGGAVHLITLPPRYDFAELRKTPEELRNLFKEKGFTKIVGFQTRNPLQRAHVELMRRAAGELGAQVLLHPVVGLTKEGDIDYLTRVRAYKRVHQKYMHSFAELALLPLAMRMAGPREALWHALIRKNHGCTHFIVGRDHAGPGKDKNGVPFYDPSEARELAKKYEKELGIIIVPSEEVVYSTLRGHVPIDTIPTEEQNTVLRLSGTELRRKLRAGEDVPEWFAYPEVVEELRKGVAREKKRGAVVFFTGLSGAGKSTIAHLLAGKLRELGDREVTVLDGDVVRHHLSRGLGFSRDDRDANIERIGFVGSEIAKHGGIAICSAIAPYREPREKNRRTVEAQGGTFIEVFVSTPIGVCRERDTKGLYRKADQGLIKGFTGVDDPYEPPSHADVTIDTSLMSIEQAVLMVLEALQKHGMVSL